MIRPCLLRLWLLCLVGFSSLDTAVAQGMISPVHGYLSVEPFELRKEFVMRFDTLADRLEASGITEIDVGNRTRLESEIGDFLIGKCPVEVDGESLEMELDRVHFVRPDPEKGLVVEDRESVPVSEAIVGVVFAAALDAPPQAIQIRWEVFPEDGSEAIVEAGIRGQRVARKLTPANSELTWKNEGGLAIPELLALPPAPENRKTGGFRRLSGLILGGIGALIFLMAAVAFQGRKKMPWIALGTVLALGGLGLGLAPSKQAELEVGPKLADEICYALLRNIYHAFDFRRESDIYDVLAKSADGELLTQIYLEVSRSLEVESQGGARVRVTDLDLRECAIVAPESGSGGPLVTDCEWVAVGTVTHWGHTHDRVNRYRARLEVEPREQSWRLVDLQLKSEERIGSGQSAVPPR